MKPRYREVPERVAALTEIWRQVLEDPSLDENAEIFNNGGSSMHVLQIAGQIYEVLGADVRLRHIFTNGSPSRLSAFMENE
ncbi:phosphopantetheine-binding protein [Streptomyces sp. NPDC090306]|uniref:phosphopantetheine-binding protein n=1 Tax=Streptomyces sp. NPDC090306 TaxID=3365961 RepID=UPI00380AA361